MTNQNYPPISELEILRARVAELEAQITAGDSSETSHRLAERVKELTTLYRESYLADRSRGPQSDYFSELVALLPLGWQYSDDTCASLIVRGQTYATPNYQRTPWHQRSTIVVRGKEVGLLTVGYLSQHPSADDGPFLHEERSLIDEIAKRISRYIERRQTDEAQRHLAAIVESSRDAIFSETLDGIIQTWNHAAERMFGYAASEVIGKHIIGVLTTEQGQEAQKFLERIRRGHQIQRVETKRRRKDGSDVDVALTISPIMDDNGRIVGASFIARDLSEERMVEASLRESDERIRHTFEQAAVGIAHVGPDGRLLRVNQKFCSILGYSQTELLTKTFQTITHPEDVAGNVVLLRQMLAGERSSFSLEKRYIRKDGAIVWADLSVSLVRGTEGTPTYFISVLQDISLRKEAEQALNESEARFRGLFENSPISLWEQDFSGVKEAIDRLRKQGVTDFRTHFEQRPGEVITCLAQVRLLAMNRASLDLYGAKTVDELLAGLDRLVPPEGYPLFLEELIWIAEGRTSFVWEGVNQRLSGERIHIRLHWSAGAGTRRDSRSRHGID